MNWLVLVGLLCWPVAAEAQQTPTPQQTVDSALEIAAVAYRLVDCGIRNGVWAQGIYIMALGNTADAVSELEKTNLSEKDGLKIWRDIAWAITLNYPVTAKDCADYAANSKMLASMDALAKVDAGN
jgi:hypothetical protein